MQAFAGLIQQLERSPGTKTRVEALAAFFRAADPADGAWALGYPMGRTRTWHGVRWGALGGDCHRAP